MDYRAEVAKVVRTYADELRGDLHQARVALQRARSTTREMEQQVVSFEALLALAGEQEVSEADRSGVTLHEAMATVLRSTPEGMLRAGDLAAEIDRRRLYKMRDGRPVETQQIHARVGHYPDLFTKAGTFIKLADSAGG